MNMFKPSAAKSIQEYFDLIDEPRRTEVKQLDDFIRKTVPQLKAHFAINMIGYGSFHYKGKSGREGDWPVISLASQKNYISVYVCSVKDGQYMAEYYKDNFPKADVGKSCIRFKKIDDIDLDKLSALLQEAAEKPMLLGTE
jgi:hypothetical protein